MSGEQRNLELKVRVDDLNEFRNPALALGARDLGHRRDVDTYFRARQGRLKLRESDRTPDAELIAYERPDEATSRYSRYRTTRVKDATGLKESLTAALGVLIVVAKTRQVLLYGATRIHLDQVDGLGSFVELETVISDQPDAEAVHEHERVKAALGLLEQEVIPVSYSDLVLQGHDTQPPAG